MQIFLGYTVSVCSHVQQCGVGWGQVLTLEYPPESDRQRERIDRTHGHSNEPHNSGPNIYQRKIREKKIEKIR